MSKYFVRTIEVEPVVETIEEADLISALPIDKNIGNSFPFPIGEEDDSGREKLEVYKIGSEAECQLYIDSMDPRIKALFKIERYI